MLKWNKREYSFFFDVRINFGMPKHTMKLKRTKTVKKQFNDHTHRHLNTMPNKSCAFSAICIFFFFTHNKYSLKIFPFKKGNKGMDLGNKPLVRSLVALGQQSWWNRVVNHPVIAWRLRSGKARVVGLWEASPARAGSFPLKTATSHRGKQRADWRT